MMTMTALNCNEISYLIWCDSDSANAGSSDGGGKNNCHYDSTIIGERDSKQKKTT